MSQSDKDKIKPEDYLLNVSYDRSKSGFAIEVMCTKCGAFDEYCDRSSDLLIDSLKEELDGTAARCHKCEGITIPIKQR